MAGVLSASQFLGGPDEIIEEHIFPSTQQIVVAQVRDENGDPVDITGWSYSADYQTLIVDSIGFNRSTGKPNYSDSTIIGYFPKVDLVSPDAPTIIDASQGTYKIIFPTGMYQGPILPDARKNVPLTIFSLTWSDNSTPPQIRSQRWGFIMNYEPDVEVGDPTTDPDYTAIAGV